MSHNPIDYPSPEVFNPDRFLKDGKLNPAVRNPLTVAFGFGRRYVTSRLKPFLCSLYVHLTASALGAI